MIKRLIKRLFGLHKDNTYTWANTRIMRFATMEEANEYAATRGWTIVFFQRKQSKSIKFQGAFVNVHDIWVLMRRDNKTQQNDHNDD